jgi:hypothetical protein
MKHPINITYAINHVRLSVTTQYCGPTNTRGARVAATVRFGDEAVRRAYVSWSYEGKPSDNHDAAARHALLRWLEDQTADDVALGLRPLERIHTRLVAFPTPNGKGYIYAVEQFDEAL